MNRTWVLLAVFALVARIAVADERAMYSPPTTPADDPVSPEVRADWQAQYDALLDAQGALLATETPLAQHAAHPQAVVPRDGDRGPVDVILRRTRALLDELALRGVPDHAALSAAWQALAAEARAGDGRDPKLYTRICALRRQAVLAHPLLAIDRLVFEAGSRGNKSANHSEYGGQLLVLEDIRSGSPRLRNALAGVAVEGGRYAGRELTGGRACTPEVSFDGRTLYFGWAERGSAHRPPMNSGKSYTLETSFHIFRLDLDPKTGKGVRLRQLTDGPWNDTDPCELPNGRIVFCSGRRSTTIRCHYGDGYAINSTLFSMEADGSDQIWLSKHETGEWAPSVDHDGRIVYSRWDYMDRNGVNVHNLWTCYPDGRDPRAPHGNYEQKAGSKQVEWHEHVPMAEMGIRAVPGRAGLYSLQTAGRYYAYGTLALVDLSVPDDRHLAQMRIITPDQRWAEGGFNERAQVRHEYGTPWPLSDRQFLAGITRSQVVPGKDSKGKPKIETKRLCSGLYYVDVYGNQELLVATGQFPWDPMPVAPRPRPPVIPDATRQSAHAAGAGAPASVMIMNVYESDFEWPEGTQITALRIVQCLPKTTPNQGFPKIGLGATQQAPRFPLGTVPVMADGSAWFEAPVGREIYFQALDKQGRAVQSMRSGTYVHPGERLTCTGCHEPQERRRTPPKVLPLALRDAPNGKPWPITPDVTGPDGQLEVLTFVRHIQPILDRHCIGCHQPGQKARSDLRAGPPDARSGWTPSYGRLITGAFSYIKYPDYSRTTAGTFGARGGKLTQYFTSAHHEVKLAPAEWRTVVAWLDCLAPFYGWDWDLAAQARGERVIPRIDFDPANPLALDRPAAEDTALLAGWSRAIRNIQEEQGVPRLAATGDAAAKDRRR